jgi:preprotein translocase subunit SecE
MKLQEIVEMLVLVLWLAALPVVVIFGSGYLIGWLLGAWG